MFLLNFFGNLYSLRILKKQIKKSHLEKIKMTSNVFVILGSSFNLIL